MTTSTTKATTINLPIAGMDCTSCAAHIEEAVRKLAGVQEARVLFAAERATVTFDPAHVTQKEISAAIAQAGYAVREEVAMATRSGDTKSSRGAIGQRIGWGMLALVAGVVLIAAIGERLGLLDRALERVPWWLPVLAILVGGWPVLRDVVQAALRKQVTSHTLMTVGVIAAVAIGEWTTAALIIFFMRFANWLEGLTTGRSRQALQRLVSLQPAIARVLRDGREIDVPVAEVAVGEVVVVRPGERIPVDGKVVDGHAPVNQAPITGESVPLDKAPGDNVFAATIAQAGFLRIQATKAAADTTFARMVRLVEEAESQKAPVQRFADRFSTYYLPTVLLVALATFIISGQVLNAVAVLVVACACAIALATPVVVLASVGNAAQSGLLIKGGIALEQLARVDTLVMDKTGTLTHGQPRVTAIIPVEGVAEGDLLRAVASVEARSEHPLAKAIALAAGERGIEPLELDTFEPLPGRGLRGKLHGRTWAIGNRRLLSGRGIALETGYESQAWALEAAGKTVFFALEEDKLAGLIAVADTIRPEVQAALVELKQLGIKRLLILTGDNERVAQAIAGELGLDYRADLLPEDKIAVVKTLQQEGAVVMMVGDGINDAPALAQADVGVAMGEAGTDVAMEAADVALMRADWQLVPMAVRLGRRARRTIRQNLGFTALYNVAGIGLAALGVLPPVWAAAAQSLPDVAIMLNSARLLRQPALKDRSLSADDTMLWPRQDVPLR